MRVLPADVPPLVHQPIGAREIQELGPCPAIVSSTTTAATSAHQPTSRGPAPSPVSALPCTDVSASLEERVDSMDTGLPQAETLTPRSESPNPGPGREVPPIAVSAQSTRGKRRQAGRLTHPYAPLTVSATAAETGDETRGRGLQDEGRISTRSRSRTRMEAT